MVSGRCLFAGKKHIAVIGAGASGLTAIKELLAQGHKVRAPSHFISHSVFGSARPGAFFFDVCDCCGL
jgi:cation diffusion facilitator CzcD-associated flavoprotein CzcO